MIKKMCKYIYRNIQFYTRLEKVLQKFKRGKQLRILLYGVPDHINLGDQAQSYCIEMLLKLNFSKANIQLVEHIYDEKKRLWFIERLKKKLGKSDIIICQSGYHFSELYPLYVHYEDFLKNFPENRIVIFPQTINFEKKENLISCAEIFDKHKNCLLMCRDRVSFETANGFFKQTPLLLFPDVVTSLIGSYEYSGDRKGVLFCLRNDKEAFYSKDEMGAFIKDLHIDYSITDTQADAKLKQLRKNRKEIIERKIEQFSKYKVVVTDRYHGTIFSLIAKTPVIVISSTDHKLSSGVNWFDDAIFDDYICFANSLDEVKAKIEEKLHFVPKQALTRYFFDKYYSNIKDIIVGK